MKNVKNCREMGKTTSKFDEKGNQVIINDISVIVDNYVEIGDFFDFSNFFVKKL